MYSRPYCWRWWFAFKNRTTLIRACSGAALSLAAVPFAPVGLPVLLSLLGLRGKIMGNMTFFILGIAILSAGTYLMRLAGKLGSRLALLSVRSGAAVRCGNGIAVFRGAGDHVL
jgi:hypothetical protein